MEGSVKIRVRSVEQVGNLEIGTPTYRSEDNKNEMGL